MKELVFDIETDGLYDECSRIYCLSYTTDGQSYDTLTNTKSMKELLTQPDLMAIGHNIGLYDLLVLKKLLGLDFKGLVVDTLFYSWYLFPNRTKHGLEDWGLEFGYPKVKDDKEQWAEGDMDLMIRRCERDVKINWKLWQKQKKMLGELYG